MLPVRLSEVLCDPCLCLILLQAAYGPERKLSGFQHHFSAASPWLRGLSLHPGHGIVDSGDASPPSESSATPAPTPAAASSEGRSRSQDIMDSTMPKV